MKRDGTLLDFVRGGLMGATTDVLGYPVDLAVMAMRPFGYNVPDNQVVGGSDWLASKLTSPNGSLAELAGRTASGMVTPGVNDLLRAAGLVKGAGPMRELTTYHGSPHRINNVDAENPLGKFDLSKIGTGEGGQAFGHGLYLAESPGVAKTYQALGEVMVDGAPAASNLQRSAAFAVAKEGGVDNALDYAKRNNWTPEAVSEIAALRGKDVRKGYFYTVDLPDEHIAKMLDWDAPLSEQPEAVRKAIEQYAKDAGYDWKGLENSLTGEMIYRQLQNDARDWAIAAGKNDLTTLPASQARASQHLRDMGIPGIKYFDGGSRAAGEGTRNFVIFDPNIAKILKRE